MPEIGQLQAFLDECWKARQHEGDEYSEFKLNPQLAKELDAAIEEARKRKKTFPKTVEDEAVYAIEKSIEGAASIFLQKVTKESIVSGVRKALETDKHIRILADDAVADAFGQAVVDVVNRAAHDAVAMPEIIKDAILSAAKEAAIGEGAFTRENSYKEYITKKVIFLVLKKISDDNGWKVYVTYGQSGNFQMNTPLGNFEIYGNWGSCSVKFVPTKRREGLSYQENDYKRQLREMRERETRSVCNTCEKVIL